MASGSVVYDATLMNGAKVSNNQLQLSAAAGQYQYMQIDSFTTGDTGLTFTAWWRSDNRDIYERIFDFGNGPDSDNILIGAQSNGILVGQVFSPQGMGEVSSSISFNTGNAWNHVAWTLDPAGSGTWKLYINGAQVASQAGLYPRSVLRTSNYLGKSNWVYDPYLNGGLKYFRMYSRVLSEGEVNILFASTQKIFIGASLCLSCPAGRTSSAGAGSCDIFFTDEPSTTPTSSAPTTLSPSSSSPTTLNQTPSCKHYSYCASFPNKMYLFVFCFM
jgi:hypothetical protein